MYQDVEFGLLSKFPLDAGILSRQFLHFYSIRHFDQMGTVIKWGRCSNDPFSGYIESRFPECFVIIAINFFLFHPYYSYVLNDR